MSVNVLSTLPTDQPTLLGQLQMMERPTRFSPAADPNSRASPLRQGGFAGANFHVRPIPVVRVRWTLTGSWAKCGSKLLPISGPELHDLARRSVNSSVLVLSNRVVSRTYVHASSLDTAIA